MKSFSYLSLVVGIAAAQGVMAGETFNGKLNGVGRTTASADFLSASVNPALTTRYHESDDFGFNINAGLLASDKDDLVDTADKISDLLEELENKIANAVATPGDVFNITDKMNELNGKTMSTQMGASINLGIPNQFLSATLVVNTSVKLGAGFNYNTQDEAYLLDAVVTGDDELDDLQSTVNAQGYAITEVGIALGRVFDLPAIGEIGLGITPKMQRIDLIDYSATPKDFDDSDFDADQYTTEETKFNLDIGATKTFGNNIYTAIAVENVIPVKMTSKTNIDFKLNPTFVTAFGYDNGFLAVGIDIDLNARKGFGRLGDNQYARAGIELDAWRWAQLRVGFQHDLKGNDEDLVTAGIGLSPFDMINLDIAGMYGSDNTYGAALQIGVKI